MNAVLNESTGGSWITRNHIEQRILTRTFDDPFKLELMLKDVRHRRPSSPSDLELDLPYADLCESTVRGGARPRRTGQSLSELVRWVEHSSGVDIAPGGGPADRI